MFLILILRNDLAGLLRVLVQAHGVIARLLRYLDLKGVDDLAVVSEVLIGLCPCVNDLALIHVRGIVGIAVGRDNTVSRTALAAEILDLREIEGHLQTCSTLIVLDGPVNLKLITRISSIEVVFTVPQQCVNIISFMRDQIIDDYISRRLREDRRLRHNGS